jgi:hypothetical protein
MCANCSRFRAESERDGGLSFFPARLPCAFKSTHFQHTDNTVHHNRQIGESFELCPGICGPARHSLVRQKTSDTLSACRLAFERWQGSEKKMPNVCCHSQGPASWQGAVTTGNLLPRNQAALFVPSVPSCLPGTVSASAISTTKLCVPRYRQYTTSHSYGRQMLVGKQF